jgi:hypothetical protein
MDGDLPGPSRFSCLATDHRRSPATFILNNDELIPQPDVVPPLLEKLAVPAKNGSRLNRGNGLAGRSAEIHVFQARLNYPCSKMLMAGENHSGPLAAIDLQMFLALFSLSTRSLFSVFLVIC